MLISLIYIFDKFRKVFLKFTDNFFNYKTSFIERQSAYNFSTKNNNKLKQFTIKLINKTDGIQYFSIIILIQIIIAKSSIKKNHILKTDSQ